jgi:outer membrane biosynthesis protein TonB
MKLLTFVSVITLVSSAFASDFSDKLLTAAKDKKNQEQAKEIAKKGVEYIKGEKKAEVKPEPTPEVASTPAPAPSDKPIAKKAKKKKKKS